MSPTRLGRRGDPPFSMSDLVKDVRRENDGVLGVRTVTGSPFAQTAFIK